MKVAFLGLIAGLLLVATSCNKEDKVVAPETKEVMFNGRAVSVRIANQAPLDGSWAVSTPNNDPTLPYNWVIENMTDGLTYFRFESAHRCDFVKEIQIIALGVSSGSPQLFYSYANGDGAVPEAGTYNYQSQTNCATNLYEVPRVRVNPSAFQSHLFRIEVRYRVYEFSTQRLSQQYSKYAYFGYGNRVMWY